jgi:ABC-type glycerol-3-phosphate transport system substrate-binding protein
MHRLILIILLLAFLTACRDAPGPEAIDTTPAVTQTEQVTITLAVEGSSLNRYRPLIEAFEEENPTIRVRLVNSGEVADADESGIRALATSFDVFPYSPNRQGESQYLLDLRPLLDLDPQFDTADFLPGLLPPPLEPLWAIPTGAAYYLTFYDQSAFEAANLLSPELDWTTDDFLDAALALTVREGNEVTRWGYVPGQLRYPPLLAGQLTGPLTTPDGSLRLADPDVVAAVQWLSDLFMVHEVSPWLDEYKPAGRQSGSGGQSALALIDSGMAAMWHTTHLLFDENKEHVGVTAVPHGPHGLAAEPILYGFAASRGTAHPEATWQLLHFLSRQPPQDAWADLITPARRSVAAANNYWEQLPDNLAPALRYTAENNSPPRISFQAANLLQKAITVHIDDDVPAAVALGQLPPPTAVPETEPEVVVVPTVPVEDDAEGEGRITIAFATSSTERYGRLANQFNQENPDINVRIVERNVYATTLLNGIAGSDCFHGGAHHRLDEAIRASILPFDPFLELDHILQLDEFYPGLVDLLVADGQLWGIPAHVGVPVLYYNRQIFAEANLSPPSPDWTLADFLEIAQQLTHGEGETKQYGYARGWPYISQEAVQLFGIEVMDDSSGIPHFNFEAMADMIVWYADLVRLYEVQPLFSQDRMLETAEFRDLVRRGRVAMWSGGVVSDVALSQEVGRVALPVGPNGIRGEVDTYLWSYHILADSPHAAACWEWIKFLSKQQTAVAPGWFPAHRATAESETFRQSVDEEMVANFHAFMEDSPSRTTTSLLLAPEWMQPGFYWLMDAYWEVASGESDVATALANIEIKFNQYRQCVIDRDAFEEYNRWRACLVEVDPDLAWLFPVRFD